MQFNETPALPPHHVPTSQKVLLLIFGILLVGALSYFVWVQNSASDTADYSAPTVGKPTISEVAAELECTTAGAGQKNYTTTTNGFCFNYPSAWILTDGADIANKIVWRASLTDQVIGESDYPGQFHVYKYKVVKDLDTQNLGVTSLKDYLDKYAALEDPTYANVKAATVGEKAGYVADAGPNQFGGGKHYFVSLADSSVIEIWVVFENANTTAVLSSFKFAD